MILGERPKPLYVTLRENKNALKFVVLPVVCKYYMHIDLPNTYIVKSLHNKEYSHDSLFLIQYLIPKTHVKSCFNTHISPIHNPRIHIIGQVGRVHMYKIHTLLYRYTSVTFHAVLPSWNISLYC